MTHAHLRVNYRRNLTIFDLEERMTRPRSQEAVSLP
jgi:hypothetical protein